MLPATARVQIRNAIVSAVRTQGDVDDRDLWYAVGTGVLVFIWAMQIAHGWAICIAHGWAT